MTRQYTECPKCRGRHIEEHGTEPGGFNWWLCRDCGDNWPDYIRPEANEKAGD